MGIERTFRNKYEKKYGKKTASASSVSRCAVFPWRLKLRYTPPHEIFSRPFTPCLMQFNPFSHPFSKKFHLIVFSVYADRTYI